MLSCQNLGLFLVTVLVAGDHLSGEKTLLAETVGKDKSAEAIEGAVTADVIHDEIEQAAKKVIRVSPFELLPQKEDANTYQMDSSLYKIQSLQTANSKRKYTNIQRSKPVKEEKSSEDTIVRRLTLLSPNDKILKPKHQPKKKRLHFLYHQHDYAGNLLSKSMPVHVADGAYPVYYVLAQPNGRFGKYPLKSFDSPRSFLKYLQKIKVQPRQGTV